MPRIRYWRDLLVAFFYGLMAAVLRRRGGPHANLEMDDERDDGSR